MFGQFLQFLHDHPQWNMARTEMVISRGDIAGTIDCLMLDHDGNYHLIDWKRTSKNLEEPTKKSRKCLAPIDHLPDTTLTKYFLQLNMYKYLLGDQIDVKSMTLVQFNPSTGKYHKIDVPDLQEEIGNIVFCLNTFKRSA